MITECYFERHQDAVLFRIAVDGHAVLDVLTDDEALEECWQLLQHDAKEMTDLRMGSFGPFDVTLSLMPPDSTATIFVDGPDLENRFSGNQAAGLYLDRVELLEALSRRNEGRSPTSA